MVFSSAVFLLLFLPSVVILYYIMPKLLRNGILFTASLIFYAWGEPVYIFIMLFSTVFDYFNGRIIEYLQSKQKENISRLVMIMSVVVNIGLLGFFKYANFLIDNINSLTDAGITTIEVSLPIGISFYTFQTLSYTIDVYRKKVKANHNIVAFGMYVSMFPQLIAGPIVKYSDIQGQVNNRKINIDEIAYGLRRFTIGLAKKVIVANQMGIIWDEISVMHNIPVSMAWIGAISFSFQIYFDFSGYSDMAIGLGHMFGFRFPENFNYPYQSKSITEFWNRWHMTLGSWFREYLYIPLGGNRKGIYRQIVNLFIVWFLTGLWHGASWNFILWGIYYFVLLVLEKNVVKKVFNTSIPVVSNMCTMFFVIIGWMIFQCTDFEMLGRYLKCMFGIGNQVSGGMTYYYLASNVVILAVGAICATNIPKVLCQKAIKKFAHNAELINFIKNSIAVALLVMSMAFIIGDSYNPFLYFRF